MLAIRMFLLHLTSAAKPPAELTSTATWHNMVQSLVAFGNLLAQRFPKRPPGFGLRVAFEEDYAFRGYMPLASVLDKAHFAAARQQKQPKPAEMGVARAYSIIDLLKSCTELQVRWEGSD